MNLGRRSLTILGAQEDHPLLLLLHGLPRNSWEWQHQNPPVAEMGDRVAADDLQGFCDGARPEGVESYHLDEDIADARAIADDLAGAGTPFHLMGTSIASRWSEMRKADLAGPALEADRAAAGPPSPALGCRDVKRRCARPLPLRARRRTR